MRVPCSKQGGWSWPHVSERPQSGRCCIFGWVKSNPVTWTWAQGAALRGDPRTLRRESWEARQGRRKGAEKDGVDQHDLLWARGPQSRGTEHTSEHIEHTQLSHQKASRKLGSLLASPRPPQLPHHHSICWWPRAAPGVGALTLLPTSQWRTCWQREERSRKMKEQSCLVWALLPRGA